MNINEVQDKLAQDIFGEVVTALQAASPPEAQGAWKTEGWKIRLDKIMNPEAHEKVTVAEEGGRVQRMVNKVIPSAVSRIPKRIPAYLRRTKNAIQRVKSHRRTLEQPSLEEQMTPKEVEEDVFMQKQPFIAEAIKTAIERAVAKNKNM